jgi:hypothetical protein
MVPGMDLFSENRNEKETKKAYFLAESLSLLFYYVLKSWMFIDTFFRVFSVYDGFIAMLNIDDTTIPQVNLYLMLTVFHYISQIQVILAHDLNNKKKLFIYHHFITILVVLVCYLTGYANATMFIVFYHDFSDIFLYLTWVFRATKESWATFSFPAFYAFFVVGRIILFPFTVFCAYYYNMHLIGENRSHFTHGACVPICACIYVLQCYWEKLIRGLIMQYLRTGRTTKTAKST